VVAAAGNLAQYEAKAFPILKTWRHDNCLNGMPSPGPICLNLRPMGCDGGHIPLIQLESADGAQQKRNCSIFSSLRDCRTIAFGAVHVRFARLTVHKRSSLNS